MAKKLNILTIAVIGAAAYYIVTAMKRKRGATVTADSPIKQTEQEFASDYSAAQAQAAAETAEAAPAATTPLTKITNVINTLFPKKTAAQKAAKAAKKATKKATKVAKKAAKKAKIKGFGDDQVIF